MEASGDRVLETPVTGSQLGTHPAKGSSEGSEGLGQRAHAKRRAVSIMNRHEQVHREWESRQGEKGELGQARKALRSARDDLVYFVCFTEMVSGLLVF